jgi:hypothetical protein
MVWCTGVQSKVSIIVFLFLPEFPCVDRFFNKSPVSNFTKIHSVVLSCYTKTDRQMDMADFEAAFS